MNRIAIPTSATNEASIDKFLQDLRRPLSRYRFFKKDDDIQIVVNGEIYYLTIKHIYPISDDNKQLFLNSSP